MDRSSVERPGVVRWAGWRRSINDEVATFITGCADDDTSTDWPEDRGANGGCMVRAAAQGEDETDRS